MSYGEQTRNPWEDDRSEPEDETRFACACGDLLCVGYNDDPANIHVVGIGWYAADCDNGRRTKAIVEGRELASRADVARDDDFMNRTRR